MRADYLLLLLWLGLAIGCRAHLAEKLEKQSELQSQQLATEASFRVAINEAHRDKKFIAFTMNRTDPRQKSTLANLADKVAATDLLLTGKNALDKSFFAVHSEEFNQAPYITSIDFLHYRIVDQQAVLTDRFNVQVNALSTQEIQSMINRVQGYATTLSRRMNGEGETPKSTAEISLMFSVAAQVDLENRTWSPYLQRNLCLYQNLIVGLLDHQYDLVQCGLLQPVLQSQASE